jgi:hypothetical protein
MLGGFLSVNDVAQIARADAESIANANARQFARCDQAINVRPRNLQDVFGRRDGVKFAVAPIRYVAHERPLLREPKIRLRSTPQETKKSNMFTEFIKLWMAS